MPCSMRSNQTIPVRFTTVTILMCPDRSSLRLFPAGALKTMNRAEGMNASVTTLTRLEFNIAFSVLETVHLAERCLKRLTHLWLSYCFQLHSTLDPKDCD